MMGFGTAISLFYKNYVNFEGRASRAEYWWPLLMQLIIYTALIIAFVTLSGTEEFAADGDVDSVSLAIIFAGILFWLVNLLPGISVKVRRFHDLDQTGWLVLVFWAVNIFVPLVEFGRMIWFAFPGTTGPNQYGPDPHEDHTEVFG